jgi:hypothetical protein
VVLHCLLMTHVNGMQVTSLEPATHIYSAWEGFSQCSKQAVAELFVNTQSVHAIAIVQRHIKGQVSLMQHMCCQDVQSVALHSPPCRQWQPTCIALI